MSTTSPVPAAQGCLECQPSNERDLLSQTCPLIAGQMKHIWKPARWKDRNGHYLMPEIFRERDQKHLLWEEMREEMACYSEKEREREREVSCEGEDMAGEEEKVRAQYAGRKRAAGVGCISETAQIRRKQSLLGR